MKIKNTPDFRQKGSTTPSIMRSQISSPRLTPLKMLERNRNAVVSKEDINRLEDKIKGLEVQIRTHKESKQLNKLETILNQEMPPG